MKLYDVPNKSYVRPLINQSEETLIRPQEAGKQSEVKVPIGVSSVDTGQLIYFSHIDGMYSLCHEVNEDTLEHGEVTHIAAWTEVEVVDLKSLFTFDQLREKVGRSGYGKDGRGTYRKASISKMSDNWLSASVDFVPEDHPHRPLYIKELEYRKEHGIIIEDTEA